MKLIGVFALILGLTASSFKDKEQLNEPVETQYFTKLAGIISPNLEYLGRGEISKVEAETLKHYRFVYNEKGELSKIQYFDKNQPDDNSYYGTHEVRYSHTENQLTRSYYNREGKKATTYRHYYLGNDIHKEIFQLDENRDKISLILKDSVNNQIESGIGTYLFEFYKINDTTFIQKHYKKDGSPNVLTSYFPFHNAKISQKNGYLYSIANVNEEGNLTMNENAGYAIVVFDFDAFGNELGWSFRDVSVNLSNRKEYLSMDYGFAKVVYQFNWENEKLGLHRGFEEAYFDEKNNPTENNRGIHRIQYEYDQNGNFSRMMKYAINGNEAK